MINKLKKNCCIIVKSEITKYIVNSEEEVKKAVAKLKLLKSKNIEIIKLW